MHQYRVVVIPGDGIGQEVIPEGLRVLEAAATRFGFQVEYTHLPWGCDYYLETGAMMPPDGLETLARFDAIYLGAIGSPTVPDHLSLWGLLLPIRHRFQQYINLRPARLLPGIVSPLRDKGPADIDIVCIRENTEGEYSGVGGRVHVGTPYEVAIQTDVFTRTGVERVLRYSFDLARKRRRKLTMATKSNAGRYAFVFWDSVFDLVKADYPDIDADKQHIDALAARFITHPQILDVVVGSNLFGDILTDIGGAISGSLGMAASANLSPEKLGPAMFEPVHGSAPDIAGKGIANPIGAIWAASLMIDYLGEPEAANTIMHAIERTVLQGTLTRDVGGQATTREVGAAIADLTSSTEAASR
jgi:tartrate dehydrogenase/decarboxylase/D-malate dehydrogenase